MFIRQEVWILQKRFKLYERFLNQLDPLSMKANQQLRSELLPENYVIL